MEDQGCVNNIFRSLGRAVVALALLAGASLSAGTAYAAAGGTITLTPSTTTAAAGDLVDFTIAVSSATAGATNINSAGVVIQWDKNVLALDASSALGVINDNDPSATPYLDGLFGNKQNDQNNRITFVTAASGSDVMEIRDASLDNPAVLATSTNQYYINYTRTAAANQAGAVISNLQFFTIKLRVKDAATLGTTTVKGSFIAVSDNAGSTAAQYTPGTVALNVVGRSMAITSGNNQNATAGTALASPFVATLTTGGTANVGVAVTFTAPTGATFAGSGAKTETVTTVAGGVATSSLLTLATTAGTQNVTASATGYTSQVFNVTANPSTATAAQSTISPSTRTITVDQTAVFTVSFKDVNNNSTTALGGAALAAAGSNAVGAGWAVVNNGDGTATATYTPGALGTDGALQITLGGARIGAANLSVTVNPGTATAAQSTIAATSATTITADQTATFNVTLKDSKGNATTTVAGLTTSTPALTGATWAVVDNGNGTATATYIPKAAGTTETALQVLIGGVAVGGNQTVIVNPGAAVASSAAPTWSATSTTADTAQTLTIQLKDAKGNNLTAGGDTVAVAGANAALAATVSAVADNGNGTYSVTYTPQKAGTENLTLKVNNVAGSTIPALTITPGAAVAANTTRTWAGVAAAAAGTTTADNAIVLTLQLVDQFGNNLIASGGTVLVTPVTALLANAATAVTDNTNGSYTVTYTPSTAGTEALQFTLAGGAAQAIPALTVTPGASVAGSATATWSAAGITADQTATLTIQLKDAKGNNLTAGGATVAVAGNALAGAAVSAVTDNGNGTYTATYTPSTIGTEVLTFTVGGTAGSTVPTLTVTHGAADHVLTTVNPTTINLNGTSTAVVTATIVDAKGNTVAGTSSLGANNAAATATVTFSASATTLITLPAPATAPATAGVATLTVTAKTGSTNGSVTLSATTPGLVTVASNTTATLTATAFVLNNSAISLIAGDTFAFTLTNGSASSAWALGANPVGSLSAATGTASTYTAGNTAGVDTLTVTDTGGKSTTATITLKTAVATDITAATGILTAGTQQIVASGGDGVYTYTSSNTAVLTVNATGLVTAVAPGTATVTVTDGTTYNGATTANSATTANLVVLDPIALTSGAAAHLDTGANNTSQIALTGGSAGNTFASGNTAIATVSATGLITAVATGTTTIAINEGTYNTSASTVIVTVRAPLAINDTAGTALTATQTVTPTGSLTVTPAGGSGSFTATVTNPASAVSTLTASAAGNFTFTPPTTGAFAGDYALTLTDSISNLATTLTMSVPLKVTASRLNILESDATQTVTITGGAANDVFTVVVLDVATLDANGNPTPDTGVNAIAADIPSATAILDVANGNPATATIVPANVTAITPFTVQATNTTQPGLAVVTSRRMHVVAENLVTLTVTDSATNAPITTATVVLRLPAPIIGAANVTTTTNAQGIATPTLPVGGHKFDVTAANYQPGVITLAQGATSGAVALTPITTPVVYTGTIGVAGGFVLPAATTKVIAVDAAGNRVPATVNVAAGGATATFTLTVDANAFVPVRFIAKAPGAIADIISIVPASGAIGAFTLKARPAAVTLTALTADIRPAGAPDAVTGLVTFTPGTGLALNVAGATAIEVLGKPTATAGNAAPSTTAISLAASAPVIQVFKTGAGAILSAPVTYQALADANTGVERRQSAGTLSQAVGDVAPDTFTIPNLNTASNVKVHLPINTFKATDANGAALVVKEIFTTVSGVKAATATGLDKAKLTGGEIVEIDLVAFDAAGNVLSMDAGNTNLDQGVEIRVPIDSNALVAAGFTASTANAAFASGQLVIYTAPTVADFEAGTSLSSVPGPITYDPASGDASFFAKHFSAFGAGAGAGVTTRVSSNNAFLGCSMSPNPVGFDPMLPLLALIAALSLWWRREKRC